MESCWDKFEKLRKILNELGSVVVAYSGGVDSTFLLKAAHDVLGKSVLAVTSVSSSIPQREVEEAKRLAAMIGVKHKLIYYEETEESEDYAKNPANRCFYCKEILFSKLAEIAKEEGFKWVVEGSNATDTTDHRPGMAAAHKHGVRSPLIEAGMTKEDIRFFSKELGLPTWDKPEMACLASRIPYGEPVTAEKLRRVELAEEYVRGLGVKQVRVRHHSQGSVNLARIEVEPESIEKLRNCFDALSSQLKKMGFARVEIDPKGYRRGSLNKAVLVSERGNQDGSGKAVG